MATATYIAWNDYRSHVTIDGMRTVCGINFTGFPRIDHNGITLCGNCSDGVLDGIL